MKLNVAYAAGAVLLAGFLIQTCRGSQFERRAEKAEAFAEATQRQVDSLRVEAAWAETQARKTDTVVIRAREAVARVDSIFPPDTSCAPNLNARDLVISAQALEIGQLKLANSRLGSALALLQASNDALAKALASRPRFGKVKFRGPSIGPSVQLYPGAVRLGVSLQFGGLGL